MTADGEGPQVEIDIPARTDLVTVVRMIVAAAATSTGALEGDRLEDLRWVTSEAITNAIEANHQVSDTGRVRAHLHVDAGGVRLVVADEGPGLPELGVVPDMDDPERLLIEGGFGVPLMEQLSTSVTFHSVPTGTTVELDLRR